MELDNVIKDYINSKNADYAIMINGVWGAGKSYYWKVKLEPLIRKQIYKDTREEKICYKPLHISLFGITNLEELILKIFAEVNPILNSKASKIGGLLFNKALSFFNISEIDGKDIKTLLSPFNISPRYIFCFDDLERLDSSLLLDVLGFVNSLIENDLFKVILICNESELDKNCKGYKSYKEKLIRYTHYFEPNIPAILESMISPIKETYRSFLKQKMVYIGEMYAKGLCNNLRTLKFNIDVFEKVYDQIYNQNDLDYKEQILDYFFYLSILYSIEYKNGISNEQLMQLKSLTEDITWNIDLDGDEYPSFDKPKVKQMVENDEDYWNNIKEKYTGDNCVKFGSSAGLLHYISTGYYNKDLINEDIQNIIQRMKKEEVTQEQTYMQSLMAFWDIEDAQINTTVNEIIHKIPEGVFQLSAYPAFFATLTTLQKNHFIDYKMTSEKLCSLFLDGIKKSELNASYLKGMDHLFFTYDRSDPYYPQIENRVLEINNKLGYKEVLKKFEGILLRMNHCEDLWDIVGYSYPLLANISASDFLESFIKCSNKEKRKIVSFLQERYEKGKIGLEIIRSESLFFIKMRSLLLRYNSNSPQVGASYKYMIYMQKMVNSTLNRIKTKYIKRKRKTLMIGNDGYEFYLALGVPSIK